MIRTSLAEILLASDTVTTAQVAQAGAVSRQRGVPLPEVLVEPGRNNPSLYAVNGRPVYVHLNG